MDEVDWQEAYQTTEFFCEGHIKISREVDNQFRAWLSEHTGYDPIRVNGFDVRWSWEQAENDGRNVTVAVVRW